MAQAIQNPDPYFYARPIEQAVQQRKALGQKDEFSSQEITDLITANFAAQQQNQQALQAQQLEQQKLAYAAQSDKSQLEMLKQKQKNEMWQGIGSSAISLLGKYLEPDPGKQAGGSNIFSTLGDSLGSAWDYVFGGSTGNTGSSINYNITGNIGSTAPTSSYNSPALSSFSSPSYDITPITPALSSSWY